MALSTDQANKDLKVDLQKQAQSTKLVTTANEPERVKKPGKKVWPI